ncbi:MAG TPA: transcriptional regulator [Nocardioides bacterium]|nr:transcriptional regulator [Nocardioides sp.]
MLIDDVKPFAVVDDLAELSGPSRGVVTLDHSILWAPGGPDVSLDTIGGVRLVYRAVLSEGTRADVVAILNRDLLTRVWARLTLPRRVRKAWEDRFPELKALSEELDHQLAAQYG